MLSHECNIELRCFAAQFYETNLVTVKLQILSHESIVRIQNFQTAILWGKDRKFCHTQNRILSPPTQNLMKSKSIIRSPWHQFKEIEF
eukprot:SAG22_NODE_4_length_44774_cov_362.122149_41_plen_88_part_00